MSTNPNKSLDEQKVQERNPNRRWSLFRSSEAATRTQGPHGTDPTTSRTPYHTDRSEASSSALACNGYPKIFADERSIKTSQEGVRSTATDAKPAASVVSSGRTVAGGFDVGTYFSGGPSAEAHKSPWKHPTSAGKPVGRDTVSPSVASWQQQTGRMALAITPRSSRHYCPKSEFLTGRHERRMASNKRSRQDPEVFRRVLGDPQNQLGLNRLQEVSSVKRTDQGFGRFLPQRGMGTNQSGSRVPLSDQQAGAVSEQGTGTDSPPQKRTKRVAFDNSAGSTRSDSSSSNAEMTPLPQARSKPDVHGTIKPDDRHTLPRSMGFDPPYTFCNSLQLEPLADHTKLPGFSITSDPVDVLDNQFPVFDKNIFSMNLDESKYHKAREELRLEGEANDRLRQNSLAQAGTENEVEPSPWKCENCEIENKDDESECQNCKQRRPRPKQYLGWDGLFKPDPLLTWKCENCLLKGEETDLACRSCNAPRPSVGDKSVVPTQRNSSPGPSSAVSETSAVLTNAHGFSFGLQPPAQPTTSTSIPFVANNNNNGHGSQMEYLHMGNDQGTITSVGPSPGDLNKKTSTTSGFVFGTQVVPKPVTSNTSNTSSTSIEPGGPEKLQAFSRDTQSLASHTPTTSDIQASAKSNENSTASFPQVGLTASPAPASFAFGVPSVVPLSNQSHAAHTMPTAAALQSISSIDLDRTARNRDQSKKRRPADSDNGSAGSTTPMPPPLFGAPAASSVPPQFLFGSHVKGNQSNETATDTGTGTATPSGNQFMFGASAQSEKTFTTSSAGPIFSFGSSNASSVVPNSSASQGLGLSAPAADSSKTLTTPPLPEKMMSSVNSSFSFGTATPAPAPGAFPFLGIEGSSIATNSDATATGLVSSTNTTSSTSSAGFAFGSSTPANPTQTFGGGLQSTLSNPPAFSFGSAANTSNAPSIPSFGSAPDPFSSRPSPAPAMGFATSQPFGAMPGMAPSAGAMSFGSSSVLPAAPVGNGFGNASTVGNFGNTTNPNLVGTVGFGGGFGSGMSQQDVLFSIGTSSGSRGRGRRIVRAKRPGAPGR